MRIARLPLVAPALLLVLAACSGASDAPAPPATQKLPPDATSAVAGYEPTVAHRDARLGVPSFTWLRGAAGSKFATSGNAEEVAWAAVRRASAALGLGSASLAAASTKEVDRHGTGVVVARLAQAVDGVDVYHASLGVALARDLEPVAIAGALAPSVTPRARHADFRLGTAGAAVAAAHAMTGRTVAESELLTTGTDGAGFSLLASASQGMQARVKRVWFPQRKGLDAAYHVELDVSDPARADSALWSFVVDANDGTILARENLVHADSFTYRVFAEPSGKFFPYDSPLGNGAIPHPAGFPNRLELPYVASNLVTLASSPFSRNDPWLPASATGTTGNNVDAYADLAAPDGFGAGDLRPAPNGKVFDFPYDPALGPHETSGQRAAVAVQMFYLVNFMHDWFYDAGFDEIAGNYQTDNFGRGGVGSDPIRAEVEDYNGVNNANASTPADGAPGRIQMYRWFGKDTFFAQVTSPAAVGDLGEVSGSRLDGNGPDYDADLTRTGRLVADACQAVANGAAGTIVVARVGACSIERQILNAQTAGAAGMLVIGTEPASPPAIANDPALATPITIPAMGLNAQRGAALETALRAGAVTLRMKRRFRGPDRDAALDTFVAAHEWGHAFSARVGLAGSSLQEGAISEGLSDLVGLLVVARADDTSVASNADWNGTFGGSGYVSGGGETNGLYYGGRRYPYSADLARNPLTFKHIADGAPLPTNVPVLPNGIEMSEIHNGGEVVASMLWECYTALLRERGRLSFDEAQSRMKKYLVAALKLLPENPTILELRDAFLATAAASDRQDQALFATAFAKRGAGYGAVGPERTAAGNLGVVESFAATGADVTVVGTTLADDARSCDDDGVLDDGETGRLVVTVRSTGFSDVAGMTATVTSNTPGVTVASPLVTFPTLSPYGTISASVEVTMTAPVAITPYTFSITLAGPARNLPLTVTHSGTGNYDGKAASSTTDHVDAMPTAWTTAGTPAAAGWRQVGDASDRHWFAPGVATVSDAQLVSPPLPVSPVEDLTVTFQSRWQFETDPDTGLFYDGGVLEISDDDGLTWKDAGAVLTPAYGGKLETSPSPLSGRSAFVGEVGTDARVLVTARFGRTYAGKTVKLRFRAGSDDGTSANGWEVDDITVTGITSTPFTSRVPDIAACVPVTPDPNPDAPAPTPAAPAPTNDAAATQGGGDGDDGGCNSTRSTPGGLLPGLALALVAALRSRSSRTASSVRRK